MKKAVLMVRVSTDEQAKKGYSLGVQEEQLINYCSQQNIEVVKIFKEDHSAKNFNRPEFNKFLEFAKSNNKNIDLLLFTSWDRFSRNAPDAYQMIRKMRNWGIEPQAIQQPIDFSVPQSKIMLSIYLTLPEVDNDIRSEKTKAGIRGANKLGRWTASAPKGYKFSRDSDNKPILIPTEDAPKISWAFNEISKGLKNASVVRKELEEIKGLLISKTTFYSMLKNTCYIGVIVVKAYKDEPQRTVKAIHQPLISEELFYKVQSVLDGRKQVLNRVSVIQHDREELPLRGIIQCSNCNHLVTGSASRSKTGVRHWYYHCNKCKKVRFRANSANNYVFDLLKTIGIGENAQLLYEKIIRNEFKEFMKNGERSKSRLEVQLEKQNLRMKKLKNSFMDEDISASDFSEMKSWLENEIRTTKQKLLSITGQQPKIESYLKKAIAIIPNITEWYRNGGVRQKQLLLSSIFPDKLIIDKNGGRTPKINSLLGLILRYDGGCKGKEKGLNDNKIVQSRLGSDVGLGSNSENDHLMEDYEIILRVMKGGVLE